VERPPPRPLQDDDDFSIADPIPSTPTSPLPESPKPAPRPYIRRSRSSSSGMNSPNLSIGQALDDGGTTPITPGSPLLLNGSIKGVNP
jgi:protein phosphatase 1 regulatory subunit 37